MSKFKSVQAYGPDSHAGYRLLPFRFTKLDSTRYIATNACGEFVLLDRPSLEDFARHRLERDSPLYADLKAKHFLLDSESSVAIDLLALKTRTKLSSLVGLTGLHIFVVTCAASIAALIAKCRGKAMTDLHLI